MAPRAPLFVERQSYRRRRVMDGARILPVVGFVLTLLPALWTQSGRMGTAGEAIYLFALWLGLIVVAALLSRHLRREGQRAAEQAARPRAAAPEATPETPPGAAP